MSLTIKSPAFQQGRPIPKKFTCDGPDVSPALEWSGAPEKTKSFALIMDDPDAPPGTWVHWVAYGIPGSSKGLHENFPKAPSSSDGTMQGLCWGVKEFGRVGYHGPCPPPGGPHRYFFKLYALDFTPKTSPRKNKFEILSLIKGHVLAEAELMGTYQK